MPLKLLMISPLPPPAGGIASWSVGILRELRSCLDVAISHVDTAVRWRSSNDRRLFFRILGGALQAFIDTGRVSRAIRHYRPDVLHICSSGSFASAKDIMILFLARKTKLGSVLHYRFGRIPEVIAKGGWEWKLIRRAIQLSDAVVVLDRASADAVKSALPAARVELIPNPIDPSLLSLDVDQSERSRPEQSVPQVVFAGHVIPAKGITELVSACAALYNEGVSLQLRLVGQVEQHYRTELRSLLPDGGDHWLIFDGQVKREEAVAFIRSTDIFVLPSYTEGFPNAILEAMAMGRAIVATRVGAIPEMLVDGSGNKCGVLVAPAVVSELKDAIRFLIKEPEEASKMGQAARGKALSCYTMKNVMKQYKSLWFSLNAVSIRSR